MIVSVTSKDGHRLYTKVKAAGTMQAFASRDALQKVADQRTTEEMLADGYYLNPGCAQLAWPCAECRARVAA